MVKAAATEGSLKVIMKEAVEKAKRLGVIPADYVGKMVINCNNGGLTSVEKTEVIR